LVTLHLTDAVAVPLRKSRPREVAPSAHVTGRDVRNLTGAGARRAQHCVVRLVRPLRAASSVRLSRTVTSQSTSAGRRRCSSSTRTGRLVRSPGSSTSITRCCATRSPRCSGSERLCVSWSAPTSGPRSPGCAAGSPSWKLEKDDHLRRAPSPPGADVRGGNRVLRLGHRGRAPTAAELEEAYAIHAADQVRDEHSRSPTARRWTTARPCASTAFASSRRPMPDNRPSSQSWPAPWR